MMGIYPFLLSFGAEAWHSLAASFLNVGNTLGQGAEFSTVNAKAERNAVDAQIIALNVWERLWTFTRVCTCLKVSLCLREGGVMCAVCLSLQAAIRTCASVRVFVSMFMCVCSASHCGADVFRRPLCAKIKGDGVLEICWLTLQAVILLLNGP